MELAVEGRTRERKFPELRERFRLMRGELLRAPATRALLRGAFA
jgi:hypothetical protein